jgi:hypothetical protein
MLHSAKFSVIYRSRLLQGLTTMWALVVQGFFERQEMSAYGIKALDEGGGFVVFNCVY